jgi:PKD repeat protein
MMKSILSVLFFSLFFLFNAEAQQCPDQIINVSTNDCFEYVFELGGDAFGNVLWDFSDGGSVAAGIEVAHTYAAPGTYTVCANPISMQCPGFCIEVVVTCNNCVLDVEVQSQTDELLVLSAFNISDGANVYWLQDGSLVNIGEITTFILQPGPNQICAFYTSPECPEGVEWCETFYYEVNDCPTGIAFDVVECGVYEFYLEGASPNAQVFWIIDGNQFVNSGSTSAISLEPGSYVIAATYNSEIPVCMGSTYTLELVVEECEPDLCPNVMTYFPSGDNCLTYTFGINNMGDFGNVIWHWGDGSISSGTNFVNHTYTESGEYVVCVEAWTGDCPEGVEICMTVFIPDCEITCPGEIVATNIGCGLWTFSVVPGDAVTGGIWNFGDGTYADPDGNSVTHQFDGPGVYEVSVNTYLNQPCFNNFFSISIEVENCEGTCPEGIVYDMIECGTYVFNMDGGPQVSQIFWNIDGFQFVTGGMTQPVELAPGWHYVSVVYFSPEFPECNQLTFELELFVEDCEPTDCPSVITYTTINECGVYLFNINNFGDFGEITWFWGDGAMSSGGNNVGHAYFEPGEYQVCAEVYTLACPDGVEVCTTVVVPECEAVCPGGIFVENINCGLYEFILDPGSAVTEATWDFGDGESASVEGNSVVHQYDEPGVYVIEVNSSLSIPCFNNYFIVTIVVEECNDDCPTEITAVMEECGTYLFELEGSTEGSEIMWNFGNSSQTTAGGQPVSVEMEPGTYIVYAIYFNSNLPQCTQQTYFLEITIEECDDDCNIDLTYSNLGDGLFEFTAVSYPIGVDLLWNFGDGTEMYAPWNTNHEFQPGTYTVCVSYESNICTFPVESCLTITVPEPEECLGLLFSLESELNANGPSVVSFSLSEVDGTQFQFGTVFFTELSGYFEGAVCLPNGCYELNITSPTPIGPELLAIQILLDGLPFEGLLDIIQISSTEILLQINVNSECDFSVSVDENALDAVMVYPIPTIDVLNIDIPNGVSTSALIFNATGQLVYNQRLNGSTKISTATWAKGIYLLQIQSGDAVKTQRIQKM